MDRTIIFNPQGDRETSKRKVIFGNPTNIMELNNVKYQWAFDLYKTMGFTNFWVPEEIPMHEDKKQYEKDLSPYEKRAYEMVLSFLIALDSYQVNMLKEFARYITAPELVMALTSQEFQEALHSYSYQFILESVVEPQVADEIYNYWRQDTVLMERNQVIAQLYNEFIRHPTEENFIKATFGNYVLESLYFYSGFAFFYTLGRQGKMRNTVQQIKYINRDELTHVTLFRNIIQTIKQENPELFTPELEKWVYEFFKYATDAEIKWGQYVTQNQILGINNTLIDRYIKYLANLRLTQLGYKPLYPEITENPMKWIDQFRTINDTKTDFFQAKPQTYAKRSELKW
ncbi:ribonucleotide reductase [Hydrogenobacter thermophilus TK-6]|uniref:Ribonucleoside-diphosphate reductase subunit beta n=1 Tax=Hydrogenobacter thermophilus (strain DSM 6534 / IAM 12695 / TK-6) TaxID=608538 RepID=D3DF90_HYDTT|nr:ribonucleotide-diphosphate reductase subunit beta [Hydrogenobacter thermophilus]ADO44436.1 ribonucleotide reductase [Hydrogenobacter thermophilus TK-6]BAI68492.1 ribonucleotide reductase beta subunit [Hydrogenobacter thermophilus TK-6]